MKEGEKRKSNVLGVRFWYTGIRVKNLEKSIRFYREALGFQVVLKGKMSSHAGTYVHMRTPTGKQILELNYYPGTSKFHQDYVCRSELDRLGFYVRNVREQYERLVGLGCEPAVEPFNQGSWVLAFVKDPNGIWLELIGRESRKKYSTLKTVHPYSMFSSRSERGWLRRTCLARAWHRGVVRTVSRSHRKLFFCVQYTAL